MNMEMFFIYIYIAGEYGNCERITHINIKHGTTIKQLERLLWTNYVNAKLIEIDRKSNCAFVTIK